MWRTKGLGTESHLAENGKLVVGHRPGLVLVHGLENHAQEREAQGLLVGLGLRATSDKSKRACLKKKLETGSKPRRKNGGPGAHLGVEVTGRTLLHRSSAARHAGLHGTHGCAVVEGRLVSSGFSGYLRRQDKQANQCRETIF